jgi:hypothetical protein
MRLLLYMGHNFGRIKAILAKVVSRIKADDLSKWRCQVARDGYELLCLATEVTVNHACDM